LNLFLQEFIAWNWCDVCSSFCINSWKTFSRVKSNVRSFGLLRNVVVIKDSVSIPEKSLYKVEDNSIFVDASVSSLDDEAIFVIVLLLSLFDKRR